MQTVALKPKRAEWTAMIVSLVILCAAMFAVPALCVPLALIGPLLACPLVGQKTEPLAWVSAAAPTLASVLAGYDAFYSVNLVLIGLLPMLITRFVPVKKRAGAQGMLMYISAVAFALLLVLAMATRALGGPLQVTLAEALTRWVSQAKNPSVILRQFAAAGLLSVPEGYMDQGVMRPFMEAVFNQQMLKSLRLTMEMLLAQTLPSLFVQGCVLVGVFTSLRLERVSGVLLVVETRTASEKRTRVVAPPSFRLLALPRSMRGLLLALAAAALVMMMTYGSLPRIIGQLCYATLETLFSLLGAAVLVFMSTKNDPDRRVLSGVMAAALYVLAPFVLFMIGLADQTFHFRTPQAQKPD